MHKICFIIEIVYFCVLFDRYLALKFQEMEENMRKQKKGKGNSTNENEVEEDTNEVENVTIEEEEKPTLVSSQNEEQAEEDEEYITVPTPKYSIVPIHLKPITPQTISSTLPSLIVSSQNPYKSLAPRPQLLPTQNQHLHHPITATTAASSHQNPLPTTPPPRVIVESEKVDVIEIKSDGSSGHLIPGRD